MYEIKFMKSGKVEIVYDGENKFSGQFIQLPSFASIFFDGRQYGEVEASFWNESWYFKYTLLHTKTSDGIVVDSVGDRVFRYVKSFKIANRTFTFPV